MRTITFQDVLAWHRCPLAAAHGYVPEMPYGDLDVGKNILGLWPNSDALASIVPNRTEGVKWLQATRFGIGALTAASVAPPPAIRPGDYWLASKGKSWKGTSSFDGIIGESLYAEYDIQYLHKVGGVYEAVICDTHPLPPDIPRRAALVLYASYITSGFQRITGEPCYARLVAPGYQNEEALILPNQSQEVLMAAMDVTRGLNTIRPGNHCMETRARTIRNSNNSYTTEHSWSCPLRATNRCVPFNTNRS